MLEFTQINRTFQELATKSHEATIEEVQEMAELIQNLKVEIVAKQSEENLALRIFTGMKMWGVLRKIKTLEQGLEHLFQLALKNKERLACEKAIWDLQRNGYLSPLSIEACKESFASCHSKLKAIGCTLGFIYAMHNRAEGLLDLLTYDSEGTFSEQRVSLKVPLQIPQGVPLSQLQDVSIWLESHGASDRSPMLSTTVIEELLKKKMNFCPHGAYLLHTIDNRLTVSRMKPTGQITHLKVDLQNGLYTLQGEKRPATRLEFKRCLEKMGDPLRMRVEE